MRLDAAYLSTCSSSAANHASDLRQGALNLAGTAVMPDGMIRSSPQRGAEHHGRGVLPLSAGSHRRHALAGHDSYPRAIRTELGKHATVPAVTTTVG
jgi:hypothetical protein